MTFAFGTRGNGANAIFAKTWESYPPCIWHWLTFKSEHILLRSSTPPLSMSFRYYCTVYIAHAHYLLSSYQVSWGPEIRAWAPSDTFATYTRTTKINTQIHRQTDTRTNTHTKKYMNMNQDLKSKAGLDRLPHWSIKNLFADDIDHQNQSLKHL